MLFGDYFVKRSQFWPKALRYTSLRPLPTQSHLRNLRLRSANLFKNNFDILIGKLRAGVYIWKRRSQRNSLRPASQSLSISPPPPATTPSVPHPTAARRPRRYFIFRTVAGLSVARLLVSLDLAAESWVRLASHTKGKINSTDPETIVKYNAESIFKFKSNLECSGEAFTLEKMYFLHLYSL